MDRIAAVVWGAARGLFGGGRSLRDATSTDTDRGPFQGMRKRSNDRRRALSHARDQQLGLPLEQLQDFLFEATVVESHARKMSTVEHGVSVRRTITLHNFNCGPDHPHLRPRYLFRGLWPDRDQIQVNKRPDRAALCLPQMRLGKSV